MRSFDRREVSFVQARAELTRTLADPSADQDRHERLARLVSVLRDKYPDLDEAMTLRLLGEGMRPQPELRDPI